MKRVRKGEYGYISYSTKKQIIYTIIMFTVSLSLFFGGWMLVDTRKNLLTIVAVLGLLPACKFLVESIMFLKATKTSESVRERLKIYEDKLMLFYDLYYTTEKKNYPVSAMAIKGRTICFYMEQTTDHCTGCQKHLESVFTQNQFKGYTIKGFDDLKKFIERLDALQELSNDGKEMDPFVLETLFSISL